jgi:hypothetical protein
VDRLQDDGAEAGVGDPRIAGPEIDPLARWRALFDQFEDVIRAAR